MKKNTLDELCIDEFESKESLCNRLMYLNFSDWLIGLIHNHKEAIDYLHIAFPKKNSYRELTTEDFDYIWDNVIPKHIYMP
jgi:hypothetical protein